MAYVCLCSVSFGRLAVTVGRVQSSRGPDLGSFGVSDGSGND